MTRARSSQASATATATARAAKRTTSRAMDYLPPWLIWLSLPLFALVFWAMTMPGKVAAMLVAASLAVGTLGLARFTWHVYGRREPSLQMHATIFVAGCGVWVLAASVFGLFRTPHVDIWPEAWRIFQWMLYAFQPAIWGVWVVGGITGCMTWSIRRVSLPPESEQKAGDDKLTKLLDGARIHKAKQVDGRVVGQIEADRGAQTLKDLQGMAEPLESLHGMRRGAVRITGTDDHGLADFTMTPIDPLKGETLWPGPSHPGTSIADFPIPLGPYEDGIIAEVWLAGDHDQARALAHWLIMGMNGAGKSEGWTNAMADALTRTDFELWGSDHVKGKQTFGPLLDYMGKVATTTKEAKQLINEARDEAARRQADFGERGIKQWQKGCGYKLLMVWIEEASEIVDDSESFVRLVERARSAGVAIVASLQRASHSNIDTDARAQLAATLCFGVRDAVDQTFALPDNVIDAGATADSWRNSRPGYAYLIAPGVDELRWSMPLRTFRGRDALTIAALEKWGTKVNISDAHVLADAPNESNFDDEDVEPMPDDLDPDLTLDPDQEIQPPSDDENISFGYGQVPATAKLTTDEARGVVQQHLRTLLEQGRTHTRPRDIGEMKPRTTRTREWVRQELNRLCTEAETGEIGVERDNSELPGVFRILAPVTAGV